MKKVPKDTYPFLARYQLNNPKGYEKTIIKLRKLAREPESEEQEYWGQLESDLEHLHLA